MADLYSTDVMTPVVNSLETDLFFLYDSFFRIEQVENAEQIHFDREKDVMELAPFVSPLVEGEIVTEKGFSTDTITPAYIKPKTPLDPNRPFTRYIGEQIGGSLSPSARRQMILTDTLGDHQKLLRRRMEWMSSSVLVTGTLTISGEKYPTQSIDYQRDAALTIDLGAGSYWGESGVSVLNDLQDWSDLILDKSGSVANAVVMTTDAWKEFRADPDVDSRLLTRNARLEVPLLAQTARFGTNGSYKGNIDGYDIWVYAGSYVDSAGAKQKMLPDKTVLMVGQMEGVRAFGAIRDEEVLNAVPMYSKSWLSNDPSQRIVMTQSAPIVYPRRVNASLKAQVLA